MARLISHCTDTGKNTGGEDCPLQLDAFVWFLIGSAAFTQTEQASAANMKAAITDRIQRPNGDPEKLYPWFKANNVEKTKEADTVETLADGTKRTLRVAPESYNLTGAKVGLNQESAMIAFNNATPRVFAFDNSFRMVGKHDASGNFVGNKALLYTAGQGFSTFGEGPKTVTSITFEDPYALSVNAKVFEFTDFDFDLYEGLVDAQVIRVAASSGNVHKVTGIIEDKNIKVGQWTDYGVTKKLVGVNLYSLFPTELADTDAWVGKSAAGADVAPSSVVADSVNQGFTVTFGSAVVSINLADPDVLYGLGVAGLEGVSKSLS